MFLKLPSPSTLIFALSTPTKLSICIRHSHWVMQPLLYQSLHVSEGNHDSDAKEHLHITCPLSKAAQHIQGLPAMVLHKMIWKTLRAKVFASTFSFQGERCFMPLLLWLPNGRLHRGEAPSHLLSYPAVGQRWERQIPAWRRLCSLDCPQHPRHCPEKQASLPLTSIVHHGFLLGESYWFARLCSLSSLVHTLVGNCSFLYAVYYGQWEGRPVLTWRAMKGDMGEDFTPFTLQRV